MQNSTFRISENNMFNCISTRVADIVYQFVLAILEEMGIDVHKIVLKLPSKPIEIVALSDTPSSSKRDERYKNREQLIRKFSSESSEYNDTAESRLRSELTSYQAETTDLNQFELISHVARISG